MRQWNDTDLLSAYADRQSEEAFGVLVERYVALVYSAALRQVQKSHLAEEVAQATFIILAQKARRLDGRTILSGWLCRTAHFVARNTLKAEFRRHYREQEAHMQSLINEPAPEAWRQLAPLLDEAVAQLNEADRNAVVLRFYERKPLSEVGEILGIDPDAAQKRVSRALDKLRKIFARHGVNSTTATIAETISANSIQPVPVALAKAVAAMAIAKGATASISTLTLIKGALKIMAWTNAKTAIVVGVGLLLATGTGTVLIEKQIKARQFTPAQVPWSDAGAATPKAALQSLAWALTHGKIQRADQLMLWEEVNTNYGNPSIEHQIVLQAILPTGINTVESFKILSITPAGSGEVIVKFKKTFKQNNPMPMTLTARLHRVGSEWHVVGRIQYYPDGGVSTYLPFSASF